MTVAGCSGGPAERQVLNDGNSSTPRFDPPPPSTGTENTLHQLNTDLSGPAGDAFLAKFVPSQGAAL